MTRSGAIFRAYVWRRSRRLAIAAVLLLLLSAFALCRHHIQRDHYLNLDDTLNHENTLTTDQVSPASDWDAICRDHGFKAFGTPRRVYDLVLFSTELDWLEIRLHAHSPYVDYFVIIESPTTFIKQPKPLQLKANYDRFKDFHHKIIYKTVEDTVETFRIWDHEDFLRNAMLKEVFPSLEGTKAAQKNDVLIVSDMDELLKPGALLLTRYCDIPKRLTFRSHFYYYSFQWLHRGEQWPHPQATTFGGSVEDTLAPNDLRMNLLDSRIPMLNEISRWWHSETMWNAGWHCSSCFPTIKEMQTKLESFSHQKFNTEENKDPRTMLHRVRNGLDLFGRATEVFDRIESNKDVPHYVLDANKQDGRFKYLLDRDGEDGGFEDWPVQ